MTGNSGKVGHCKPTISTVPMKKLMGYLFSAPEKSNVNAHISESQRTGEHHSTSMRELLQKDKTTELTKFITLL